MKNIFKVFLICIITIFINSLSFAQQQQNILQTEYPDVLQRATSHLPENENSNERNVITVLPGNGSTDTSGRAPQGSRLFINTCYIIKPSEMTASGFGADTVKSVGWLWNALTGQNINTKGTLKVYLINTTDTVYNKGTNFTTAITGMTKVIDDSIFIPAGTGPFALDVPVGGPGTSSFIHTSGRGVYVAFEYKTTSTLATPLGAPTISCNNSLSNRGATYQSQTVNGTAMTTTAFGPATSFENTKKDSINIVEVYAKGKNPIEFGCQDTLKIILIKNIAGSYNVRIKVTVFNNLTSAIDIIFDQIISGALFTPYFTIDIPIVCPAEVKYENVVVEALVGTFDSPGASGVYDTKSYCIYSTSGAYNYADPCRNDTGGVGFLGVSGNIVSRFNNYSSQIFPIRAVDYTFYNAIGGGSQPYKVVIYADSGNGKPGAALYTSSTLTSPTGTGTPQFVTHQLPTVLNIAANRRFYVGIKQTSTVSIQLGFQTENPLRSKAFFYTSPENNTTWNDLDSSGANTRLDISPRSDVNLSSTLVIQGFYNPLLNTMVRDTARVYLRNFSSPYAIVDSAKAYLSSAGRGELSFKKALTGVSYYIQVKHRNLIETWNANAISFVAGSAVYDFTTNITNAYGSNMIQVDSSPLKFGFYNGDVNQDQLIDVSDLSLVDNAAVQFLNGYVVTDITGDAVVDASDLSVIDNNSAASISVISP